MIRQEVIDRIREETDIVELVGSYVPLKKVGRNWRSLCPFHAERSPSFYVNPERQSYHCFGCGAGGTAISFVMAMEKLEFPEAVRFLARRLGIEVTEVGTGKNQALYDACEQAAQFFEQQLRRTEKAQGYLNRRGLRPETVRRFRLGFAPQGNLLRGEARKRGLAEEALVRAGLLVKRDDGLADYFFERLVFPIFSLSGKIIGFSGRVLDDSEPKYLNSPDTDIFRKGDVLYGLFQAKAYIRNETPLLVEGNFDLLSLVDKGINRVVAPLGTALTPNQALLLRRYNSRVVLCFDGDEAGRKACRRALEVLLQAGLDPGIMLLPEGDDPDSFVRKNGGDGFIKQTEEVSDFVDFVLAGRRLRTVAEQRAALGELTALLRVIGDDTLRELYANRIADRFRIDKTKLLLGTSTPKHEPKTPASPQGLPERLASAAVQSQELAQIALEFCLSETIADQALSSIVRLAEERSDDPNFGPGMIMDLIEDEVLRNRVAGWLFTQERLPTPGEFRERVRRFRAQWLHQQIVAAHREGNDELAEALSRERNRLLQEIARERRQNNHGR